MFKLYTITGKIEIPPFLFDQEKTISARIILREDYEGIITRDYGFIIAVVDVLDSRVDQLSAMYQPKKTIFSKIQFLDFAGFKSGDAGKGLFSSESMSQIRNSDALALVVRNFPDDVIDAALGKPGPLRDMEIILSELVLSDLVIIERRLERIEADAKRGKSNAGTAKEKKILEEMNAVLANQGNLKSLSLNTEEEKMVSGFRFLSMKPLFIILNSGDANYGKNPDLLKQISAQHPVIEFAGKFEMELAGLTPDEAAEFMADIGISASARARLTTFAFGLLGYMSFFTVGKDEVRAWTICKGDNAVTAAGTIHTDLARGFIRAECFSYDDLVVLGSEDAVKKAGKWRLEGKEYVVRDGDILNIRFSV